MMDLQDLHEAMIRARETEPRTIHGRKVAVFDLLADSGTRFDRAEEPGLLPGLYGIDIIHDETMPPNMVEFRAQNGRVLRRLIQSQGRWYGIDPAAITVGDSARGRTSTAPPG